MFGIGSPHHLSVVVAEHGIMDINSITNIKTSNKKILFNLSKIMISVDLNLQPNVSDNNY